MAEHDCIHGHLGCSDREGGPCIDELLTQAEGLEADADQAKLAGKLGRFLVLSNRAVQLYTQVERIEMRKMEED
jgi:hypothetical protein